MNAKLLFHEYVDNFSASGGGAASASGVGSICTGAPETEFGDYIEVINIIGHVQKLFSQTV